MKLPLPLCLDEVVEIEEIGIMETYDFHVPVSHNYVANGVLVHNSGTLEQDARQVILLYWDEDNKCYIAAVAKNNYGKSGIDIKLFRLAGKRFEAKKTENTIPDEFQPNEDLDSFPH